MSRMSEGAASELLEHRRRELPSVSVAVAAQLLGVSRTTVEAGKTEGVLVSAQQRLRHESPWTMILASSAAP